EFGLMETVQVKYIDEGYSEKPEICWYPYGERMRSIVESLFDFLAEPSWRMKAALLPRFLPHIKFLARHAPLARALPGFLRYLTGEGRACTIALCVWRPRVRWRIRRRGCEEERLS